MEVKARVFVIDARGRKKYGDPIPISRESISDIFDGIDNILCRVSGASVLYGEDKVELEINNGHCQISLKGYSEIKNRIGSYEFLKKIFNL